MSKFKIKLKITGFELEMEGDRKDVHLIPQQLSQQVSGLFNPAIEIAGGDTINGPDYIDTSLANNTSEKKVGSKKSRKRSNPAGASSPSAKATEAAIDWKYDPNAWGTPRQIWNTANKSIWLLYVADKARAVKELSSGQISQTFNVHFRQNGPIQTSKVSRDLGRKKAETPALVGTVVLEQGEKWFLTEQGLKEAEKLVAEARGLFPDEQLTKTE